MNSRVGALVLAKLASHGPWRTMLARPEKNGSPGVWYERSKVRASARAGAMPSLAAVSWIHWYAAMPVASAIVALPATGSKSWFPKSAGQV
jgi:hypothetical protein